MIAASPDLILASWCGKKVVPRRIAARPGWDAIPAVRAGRIVEIKSPLILQPGPAALTDGLDAIRAAIEGSASPPRRRTAPPLADSNGLVGRCSPSQAEHGCKAAIA